MNGMEVNFLGAEGISLAKKSSPETCPKCGKELPVVLKIQQVQEVKIGGDRIFGIKLPFGWTLPAKTYTVFVNLVVRYDPKCGHLKISKGE